MKKAVVDDKTKMRVIFTCDNLKKQCVGTIYAQELRSLRTKYIYKDINFSELKRDVQWINNLRNLLKQK